MYCVRVCSIPVSLSFSILSGGDLMSDQIPLLNSKILTPEQRKALADAAQRIDSYIRNKKALQDMGLWTEQLESQLIGTQTAFNILKKTWDVS